MPPHLTAPAAVLSFRSLDFYPSAVSADGSVVVGGRYNQDFSWSQAIRWTAAAGASELGFGGYGGYWMAPVVSADGSVVVGTRYVTSPAPTVTQLVRWTADSGIVNLGEFAGANVTGVSANGSVVVGSARRGLDPFDYDVSFRWTVDGGLQVIPEYFTASEISDDGSIAVGWGYNRATNGIEASRWTSDGGQVFLGAFFGWETRATDVSGDGSVIVGNSGAWSGGGSPGDVAPAFRWTAGGGMMGLDALTGFHEFSELKVSGDGSVIVGNGIHASGSEAILWDEGNRPQRLHDLLLDLDRDVTGWRIGVADISADGLTLVGSGIDPTGRGMGWIATIPEPGSLLAFIATTLIFGIHRRKSKINRITPHQSRPQNRGMMLASALLALAAISQASRAAEPSLQPLDFVPYALSADGRIVVGVRSILPDPFGDPVPQGVRWTREGGTVSIWEPNSEIIDLSADGSVMLGHVQGKPVWLNDGTQKDIQIRPSRISANGLVVVGVSVVNPTGAARWTVDGTVIGLGVLGGDPTGVSADGSVVVGYGGAGPTQMEAFRWSAETGVVGLGILPGYQISSAAGVSDDGSVIVGAVGAGNDAAQAFRWTAERGMVGLETLPGYISSVASDVSADGSIVVGFSANTSTVDAFIWDEANQMRSIREALSSAGLDVSEWKLLSAWAISGDGSTIIGWGSHSTVGEVAWIATVPEPATLVFLAVALLIARRQEVKNSSSTPHRTASRMPRTAHVSAVSLVLTMAVSTLAAEPLRPLDLYPAAVSADGQVVVGWNRPNAMQAARWTAASGAVSLGVLAGDARSGASAVTADGSVIIGGSYSTSSGQAFRWTAAGGMVGLGASFYNVTGVSGDGSVIVGVGSSGGSRGAVRWTLQDGVQVIVANAGMNNQNVATAISEDGSVIAGYLQQDEVMGETYVHAFRWTADEGIVLIDSLDGYTPRNTPLGVSADGSVIVGDSGNGNQPFRWTAEAGMIRLDVLPGRNGGWANALSADGSVVVGTNLLWLDNGSTTSVNAFIWDAVNGTRDLHDVLSGIGVDVEGWELTSAIGISADGFTIVGSGIDPLGQRQGWIATVPEPASLTILAAAGLLLFRRRSKLTNRLEAASSLAVALPLLIAVVPVSAAQFELIATHPDAAAQPTATGQTLATLKPFNGKLYAGYGDYDANSGPIHLRAFDPAAGAFTGRLFTFETEAVLIYREINGKLYAPNIDPWPSPPPPGQRTGYAVATVSGAGGESWQQVGAVEGGHIYDMTSFDGSDLWMVGTTVATETPQKGLAWRSLDGGATWSQAPSLTILPQRPNATIARLYSIHQYQGNLYTQGHDAGFGPHSTSKVFDGTNWSNGPTLAPIGNNNLWHPETFAGHMVYHRGHSGIFSGRLFKFDGTTVSLAHSDAFFWDYTIDDGVLYALLADGRIIQTQDLASWTLLDTAPAAGRSLGVLGDTLYVGGTGGQLFLYSVPVPEPTTLPLLAVACLVLGRRRRKA